MRRRRGDGGDGGPRSLAGALGAVRAEVAPQTLLARVQEAWPKVAGELAARQGEPVSEREGVVTVACRSATWAQELDLMGPLLLERLQGALDDGPLAEGLSGLRFTATAARHDLG